MVATHLVYGAFIFAEIHANMIAFPIRHLGIIAAFGVLYALNNFTWTMVTGNPVYPVIDWQSMKSVMFLGVAALLKLVGFGVARRQYRKKEVILTCVDPTSEYEDEEEPSQDM